MSLQVQGVYVFFNAEKYTTCMCIPQHKEVAMPTDGVLVAFEDFERYCGRFESPLS